PGRVPTVADLARLHRRHAHHGLRQAPVELPVPLDVGAEAHWHAPEAGLHHAAERVAPLLRRVDAGHDRVLGVPVERAQRARVELADAVPVHAAVAGDAPETHDAGAADDAGDVQQAQRDGARGDAAGRLAGRGALEDVAQVLVPVLHPACQVGVAGAGLGERALARLVARRGVHDLAP